MIAEFVDVIFFVGSVVRNVAIRAVDPELIGIYQDGLQTIQTSKIQ